MFIVRAEGYEGKNGGKSAVTSDVFNLSKSRNTENFLM